MDKDMRGSFRKNKKKEPGSNQPDIRGKAMIFGRSVLISAWKMETHGDAWYAIRFTEETGMSNASPRKEDAKLPGGLEEMDDDVPF